jgi:hypothetical protein
VHHNFVFETTFIKLIIRFGVSAGCIRISDGNMVDKEQFNGTSKPLN